MYFLLYNLPVKDLRRKLKEPAEGGEYAAFTKKVAKTDKIVLGVRTPHMRKLARDIAKDMGLDAEDAALEFLRAADKSIFEEIFVAGLVINYAQMKDEKRLDLLREYMKDIDSWGLVDSFATRKKGEFDEKLWWKFACECMASKEEFVVRFGIVELLVDFLDDEHIDAVFAQIAKVKHDGYYVKMAIAWLYATAAQNYWNKTLALVRKTDRWIRSATYVKIMESEFFSKQQKQRIREIRENIKKTEPAPKRTRRKKLQKK